MWKLTDNMSFTPPQSPLFDIPEEEFDVEMARRGSIPREDEGMELKNVTFHRIQEAGIADLYQLSQVAGIQNDERLTDSEAIRERLILIKRKLEGSSNTWKHLFTSVRKEKDTKIDILVDLMKTVDGTFKTIPTDALSTLLREEGLLRHRDLLEELAIRMKSLIERKSLVVVAGETNGGKSSFLNLLLGEDILPTDILHCTFAICRIVYAEAYNIKTIDHRGVEEYFPCATLQEAQHILKIKVSQQEMKERQHGSSVKEITVGLPADILKSGVTLVDTPGIGEDEQMDNVTMNFVKSTHASAFIYIIKSDTAGGVQEDRLLSFLRAIKERYQTDALCESFDPRAAMFVCHRWDNIDEDEQEKVKKNALTKLEYVWPGFEPSQTYFFSTTDTMKHLPVDPAFVTDSFFELLKGLKELFHRASCNAIKYHYAWLKYLLPPASRNLRTMISQCNRNNEELEGYFRSVADKQEKLMISSKENSKKLQGALDILSQELSQRVSSLLDFDTISPRMELDYFDELVEMISAEENFLSKRENRYALDEMIIRCLLKYTDEHVSALGLVENLESSVLHEIEEHLGLFKSQIRQIKHDMLHGGSPNTTPNSSRTHLDLLDNPNNYGTSINSMMSTDSNSSIEDFKDGLAVDPVQLSLTVKRLLLVKKRGKVKTRGAFDGKHEMRQTLFGKMRDKIVYKITKIEPVAYLEERIPRVAKNMREDSEIMTNIIKGYTAWIQGCVNHATKSIPQFLKVNTQLMEVIREHRGGFQRDKDLLVKVMEELEPSRHHLRGYGELYMEDINADMLAFNVEKKHSSIYLPRDIVASHRLNDDSGFQGSGSKKRKVRSLWSRMQGAEIKIDNQPDRIIVKTYIYDMDERLLLSEIASLRCMDNPNVASFFGMTRIISGSTRGNNLPMDTEDIGPEKISAFVFRGDLISARVHSSRKNTNMQLFVPELIDGLLKGLNYIHREKLVHMELNLDTVMIDKYSGSVKLCQMCKPRDARFPVSMEVPAQNCVCLSPSVLHGHVYADTDDIYAFGLLLWECLFPNNPPFKEEKGWKLSKFIADCNPNTMLKPELMNLNVSEDVREVLKGTLLITRGSVCMPIATVQSYLTDIEREPAVLNLRSRPVSNPIFMPPRKSSLAETPIIEVPNGSGRNVTFEPTTPPETQPSTVTNRPKQPVAPSRPKRQEKKKQDQQMHNRRLNSMDNQTKKPVVYPEGMRGDRRQSEPVMPFAPNSPRTGRRKSSLRPMYLFKAIFRPNKKPSEDDPYLSDDSTDSVQSNGSGKGKKSKGHDKKPKRLSLDSADPGMKNHPKHIGDKAAKVLGMPPSHSRRCSLQEESCLYVPKTHNRTRSDSFDVPQVLINDPFVPPLSKSTKSSSTGPSSPNTGYSSNLKASSFLAGSMPCLVHCAHDDDDHLSHSHRSNRIRDEHTTMEPNSNNNHSNPWRLGDDNFLLHPTRKPINSGRRHSAVLPAGSLQNLADGSVNHLNHAIEPIIEAESQQEEQDKSLYSKNELNVYMKTSRSGSLDSRFNKESLCSIQELTASLKSNSGISSQTDNISKPMICVSEEVSPRVSDVPEEQSYGQSRGGLNSSQDLSSSSSSQGPDSGFNTDVSSRGAQQPNCFPGGLHTDLSTMSQLWDSDDKFLAVPKIHHVRSRSAPVETDDQRSDRPRHSYWDEDAQSAEVLVQYSYSTREFDNDARETQSLKGHDINDNVVSNFQQTLSSLTPSVTTTPNNNSDVPPPPPPINFSVLTFAQSDDDEADEGISGF